MHDIIQADFNRPEHAAAFLSLMEQYALEVSGGRSPLSDRARAGLPSELARRPTITTFLAFADGEPAGFAIAIEGFSSFACRPLLNIHDIMVAARFRGRGLSKLLLEAVETRARETACCKLTLEVLEGNQVARNLYKAVGFKSYELDPAMGHALFLEKKLST